MQITSDEGRIGPFWWHNSNTKPQRFSEGCAPHLAMEGLDLILWGSCGWGERVSITLKPLAVTEPARLLKTF